MSAAEKFIRFIREYAPMARQANMYHEEIEERAARMKVEVLKFAHPALDRFKELFSPDQGRLTNLILTGTAGDGKTRLLYDCWRELKGAESVLDTLPTHAELVVKADGVPRRCRFIFDLSKCVPESGQPWEPEQFALFEAWGDALLGQGDTLFIVAANDGKLLQVLRSLRDKSKKFADTGVEAEIEEMLAAKHAASDKLKVALLDLSSCSSAETFERACDALLQRPEWACFEGEPTDPAFGPQSPLRRNWEILRSAQFRSRLRTLIELCDVNDFHIPVRDILAMLVNGLLGHPGGQQHVMNLEDIRRFANPSENFRGSIYRNIFGENLSEARRHDFLVFGYLSYFRVGQETSNRLDELLLFGAELPEQPALHEAYNTYVLEPTGHDAINPTFERLRREYLEAEDFDESKREAFLLELVQQRRRLFFRLPDFPTTEFDPWCVTVFQYAGRFLSAIHQPLLRGEAAEINTLETLVRGLNRVWSGMLFDEGHQLFLTSGLEYTSARISRMSCYVVPLTPNVRDERIEVMLNARRQPELHVHLLEGAPIKYRLDLLRFEFLMRVAEGALPNSFSRECYEDVLNLKSQLLSRVQSATAGREQKHLKFLTSDAAGRPTEETMNL